MWPMKLDAIPKRDQVTWCTQEWRGAHKSDTRVTLDNDTRVTQRWRMSEARVTLGWHKSDARLTHEWRYKDAEVTQLWHYCDTTVPSTNWCMYNYTLLLTLSEGFLKSRFNHYVGTSQWDDMLIQFTCTRHLDIQHTPFICCNSPDQFADIHHTLKKLVTPRRPATPVPFCTRRRRFTKMASACTPDDDSNFCQKIISTASCILIM